MKKLNLTSLIAGCFLTACVYAQDSTIGTYSIELSVTPLAAVALTPLQTLIGAGSHESSSYLGARLGVSYQYNNWLSFHTAIGYSTQNVKSYSSISDPSVDPREYSSKIGVFELPVDARFKFLKYLYASAGPLLHIQQNANAYVDKQTGVGVNLGLGAIVPIYRNFELSVIPHYKMYSLLPFQYERYYERAQVLGIAFGASYRFSK